DNPRVLVAATADLRTRLCYLLVSTDAGLTWTYSEARPAAESYPYCTNNSSGVSQPRVEWGSDGTLYYASEAYGEGEGARDGKTSIVLARTTDLGETWDTTIVTDARTQPDPKPRNTGVTGLAVDTSGDQDAIYVGFSRDWRFSASDGDPLEDQRHVVMASSTDGGQSFGEPVNLNDFSGLTTMIGGKAYPLHFQTAFTRPFVAAQDGVILAVGDGGPPSDDPPPEEVYDGLFGEGDPLLVARSTDQGRTWTVSELSTPVYTAAGSQTGMGWTPEGGPDGTFVLAYAATPGDAPKAGRTDIVVRRSTDGGVSWTEPVAINDDDPSDGYTSFYPQLDVAPNGRVDVIWHDNRQQTDFLMAVRATYSTDGGATWAPNIAVTARPIDFSVGASSTGDVRQPPGVASTDSYAAIAWPDTRFADEQTQTQDNFGVVAQFSPLPAEESIWLTIAAAVGGLVLAGIVLLGIQFARKRG
ncbi:MAG TPA: sialidase family protein, partial [Acidimicrobiales bacterium]|nr:sialidase family protein [Acidimicrobiales bacterium]